MADPVVTCRPRAFHPAPVAHWAHRTLPRAKPRSPGDLFVSFTGIALQGFGGVVAIIQRERSSIASAGSAAGIRRGMGGRPDHARPQRDQPGADDRRAPLRSARRAGGDGRADHAAAADRPGARPRVHALRQPSATGHALRGMGVAVAGMVMATGLVAAALKTNPPRHTKLLRLGAAAFVAVAWLRWPLVYVLLGLGCIGCTFRLPADQAMSIPPLLFADWLDLFAHYLDAVRSRRRRRDHHAARDAPLPRRPAALALRNAVQRLGGHRPSCARTQHPVHRTDGLERRHEHRQRTERAPRRAAHDGRQVSCCRARRSPTSRTGATATANCARYARSSRAWARSSSPCSSPPAG